MIVFGGLIGGSAFTNEVWSLSLSGTPTWAQISPAGSAPSPRSSPVVVRDDTRARLLVFGGGTPYSIRDVWSLSLLGAPTWTELAPDGSLPAARMYAAGIYDGARDRMLVYGGTLVSHTYYGNSETLTDFQQLRFTPAAVSVPETPDADSRIELLRPTPNPAHASVEVRFHSSVASHARVAIYDLVGRRVRTLFEGRAEAGERRLSWDLKDARGARLPAGIYLCALDANGSRSSRRLIVLP